MKTRVTRHPLLLFPLVGILLCLFGLSAAVSPVVAMSAPAPTWQRFPLNQKRMVRVELAADAAAGLTTRELKDQVRDWLLHVVLIDAGLSPQRLSRVLFDLPPSRHGYFRSTGHYEYGLTRARAISEQRVVAVIPDVDERDPAARRERTRQIAHIADEYRKTLGHPPQALDVFEYDNDHLLSSAVTLTRREPISKQALFSPAFGYYERQIRSLANLTDFMRRVNDVTYAGLVTSAGHRTPAAAKPAATASGTLAGASGVSADPNIIVLAGRQATVERGIRVEDVAALWQSERHIGELGSVSSTGFSLDPAFRFDGKNGLKKIFSEAEGALRSFARGEASIGDLLSDSANSTDTSKDVSLKQVYPHLADYSIFYFTERAARNRKTLDQAAITREFAYVRRLISSQSDAAIPTARTPTSGPPGSIGRQREEVYAAYVRLLRQVLGPAYQGAVFDTKKRCGFQHARYDGNLIRGTEVAMVLFYTDLLAKLWAQDFGGNTTPRVFPDFTAQTDVRLSPVHARDLEERSQSRTWFAPDPKGFQLAEGGRTLLLSHTATRISSASSDPGNPGKESPPTAHDEAFDGWWNDHYTEVARYEPEYQRLNQIMKWSLLISWLNHRKQHQSLAFLASVPVNRSNWFPTWVKRHPSLRFQRWNRIGFFEHRIGQTRVEALPILFAKGRTLEVAGGVALAGRKVFRNHRPSTPKVDPPGRRSYLDYPASTESEFRTVDRQVPVRFRFKSPRRNAAEIEILPTRPIRLRTRDGELVSPAGFRHTITQAADDGTLQVTTEAGGVRLSQLQVRPAGNAFDVAFQSLELDAARGFADRLSRSDLYSPYLLRQDPNVVEAWQLAPDRFIVRLKGAKQWLEVGIDDAATPLTASEWRWKVAVPGEDSRIVRLAMVDEAAARREARSAKPIVRPPPVPGAARTTSSAPDPAEELASISGEIKARGPDPKLTLQRGIATMRSGVDPQLISLFGEHREQAIQNPGAFFQEINRRLADATANPDSTRTEQANLYRAAQAVDFAHTNAKNGIQGEVVPAFYDADLKLHYQLGGPLRGTRAALADLPEGAKIYVDIATLNNLDPAVGMERVAPEVILGSSVEFLEVPRRDLAIFQPDQVLSRDARTRYQAYVNLGGVWHRGPFVIRPVGIGITYSPYNEDEEDEEEKQRQRVFFVRGKVPDIVRF